MSQRVDLDSTIQFNCTANDTTDTSLQWWHDGRVLAESTSMELDYVLSNITWSDIGVYTCIITFRNNTYSASATLNITGNIYNH